ncbi:MAG TPA: hypothetical protein VH134_01800 [Candidatus Dormibacteraeota bacterium]|nr:hypothetical protein [Candidatus Dormibacteraeota bacterium]
MLAAGALLIGGIWLVAPGAAPPLYDGLEAPAEPYRHLAAAPEFAGVRPPSSVQQRVPVSIGPGLRGAVMTDEVPPQAQLIFAPDTFAVPPATAAVDVSITPVPPPAVAAHGRLDGNVYRLTVTAGASALAIGAGRHATVVLRGPAGVAGPHVELFTGRRWTALETTALSLTAPDVYAANTGALGDVALVVPPSTPRTGGGSPTVPIAVAALGAATLLGLGGLTVLGRARRRRR